MNRRNKRITSYYLLFGLLIFVGVVYSILQANLEINGTTKITQNSWNIHFDNIVVNPDSVSIGTGDSAATIDPNNDCKVDFEVTLSLPGDFYEFTVDVINNGSIDAMIGTLTKTLKVNNVATETIPEYLNYSVTYSDDIEILENHLLAKNTTETYKVRLEYRSDIDELPSGAQTISTSVEPIFIQADNEAIIVNHPQPLLDTIAENAVIDNISSTYVTNDNGVQFNEKSSDTNGKGIYLRAGTENESYPIYYYRGDVDNNHLLFANYCWRIVRTTDTGGIKLLYDGVPSDLYDYFGLNQNDYSIIANNDNFTWNSTDKTWDLTITDGQSKEISFTVPAGEQYYFVMTGTTGLSTGGSYLLYRDDIVVSSYSSGGGQAFNLAYDFESLSASNVIKFVFHGTSTVESPITFKIKMSTNRELLGVSCYNTGTATQIGTSSFNSISSSLAAMGYMYGISYTYSEASGTDWYYAPDVSYENDTYTLIAKDSYAVAKRESISSGKLVNHHYTCRSSTNTTCTSVSYVYYDDNNEIYYITLSNGKKVEDALSDMITNSTNENNSTIKTVIDNWYQINMTNYNNQLEDTVFCNDKSFSDSGGWNANGGGAKVVISFEANSRKRIGAPSLTCTNVNDAFTVVESDKGNGKLTYPVGLLTIDEVMLAGLTDIYGGANSSGEVNYLNNNTNFWLISPKGYGVRDASGMKVEYGILNTNTIDKNLGVRPSVSLKFGTKISGGSGTSSDPYIVES